jgi:hypothetical protein
MAMFNLNPVPIDKSYEAFRDGFAKWIVDKPSYTGLRWIPWADGGRWGTYELEKWDFIDFGVIGPESPLRSDVVFESSGWTYLWKWADVWSKDKLPATWKSTNDVYYKYKATRREAVWNPYDGSWREMRKVTVPGPVGGPGTTPNGDRAHKEFIRRAEQLYQDYRGGLITDEIYKIRLLELTREYT